MARATPPQVQDHLTGVAFPAQKADLIRVVRENSAPEPVVREIQNLPDREFGSAAEVREEMARR